MDQQEIKDSFFYKDGKMYWRPEAKYSRAKDGKPIGCENDKGYFIYSFKRSGKRKRIPIHKMIWIYHYGEIPHGMIVDHIDRDRKNNLVENLRLATKVQNSRNTGPQKGSSKFKGVSFNKRLKRWHAYIQYKGKRKHIGFYEKETDAAKSYNYWAVKSFGKFAVLNEVQS